MTVADQVQALALAVVGTDVPTATVAAAQLTEIKRRAKKSFASLGVDQNVVDKMEALLSAEPVEAPAEPEPTPVVEVPSEPVAGFAGKMPAGVHRLSNMPKGTNVKGKVWTDVEVILPDGSATVTGRFETKRGSFVYFYVDGQGYRAEHNRFVFSGNVLALNDKVK